MRTNHNAYDCIDLRVEAARGLAEQAWPDAAQRLEWAVRDRLGASAAVTMAPFESIQRSEGKTAWIERIDH